MKNADFSLKQWIKFTIAAILYTLFIVWVGNYWWLLLLILIFDVYLTKIIPWTFWKKAKNKTVYTICSWIDAILFALVAVYFINLYIFQNYQIPSSSLEKSLLVGDFLMVSKVHYGPRVPMTPLSMPLTQHTMPGTRGTKSYIEWPKWEYKRLAGLDTIKAMDIVVFNFPAGDTVAIYQQNPDYYSLCVQLGANSLMRRGMQLPIPQEMCLSEGRSVIKANPEQFGDVVYRPADRRENYVKRCVGLPGDSLQIIDNNIYVNGVAIKEPENKQLNYFVETDGRKITDAQFEEIGVSVDDRNLITGSGNDAQIFTILGIEPSNAGLYNPVFYTPLTKDMANKMEKLPNVKRMIVDPGIFSGQVFPAGEFYPISYKGWTRDNYGPIYIPRKGVTTPLTFENLPLYERIIKNYEGNTLEVKDNTIYINGEAADSYTFKMNYYWMMGDNRHNSADSRYWGYVPEDHIVGKPMFIWLSWDKDANLFKKIRFSRLFTDVDNIK